MGRRDFTWFLNSEQDIDAGPQYSRYLEKNKKEITSKGEKFIADPFSGSLGSEIHQQDKICFPTLKEIKD